jgi:hypothetical protein
MGAQHKNLIGPQVRRLRVAMDWSQEDLAAACQRAGWDVPRSGIGKIESRLRCVTDFELIHLAKVFKCRVGELFPEEQ